MSENRGSYIRVSALLLLLAAAAYFKFLHEPSLDSSDDQDVYVGETYWDRPLVDSYERRPYVPPDTSDLHGIDANVWVAPASSWLAGEKSAAELLLKQSRPAILVVPVQGDKNAFDLVERSLMTRIVASQLALDEDNVVLPTNQVLRYFGTNKSTYGDSDIQALARLTITDRILVLHAEHDRAGAWELRASLFDRNMEPIGEEKIWADLAYSDEHPPSVALESIVKDISEFAVGDSQSSKKRKYAFRADDFLFPESVLDLIDRADNSPLHAAAYLQFLGALHPRNDFNETRNFLFERSLVELERVEPNSPYYRYFKARAYAYLGRRPAAVALLGSSDNFHDSALLAYLNGNITELRAAASELGTDVLDFMLLRDLNELEMSYATKQAPDVAETFSNAHPVWGQFFHRAFQDYELWASYSIADIKLGLDDLLPIESANLMDRAGSMLATQGVIGELELTRLVLRHSDEIVATHIRDRQGRLKSPTAISAVDVAEIAQSIAIANHINRIDNDLQTRDIPESALREISKFESLYAGHPAVTLRKGRALQAMAEESEGREKDNLVIQSADTLLNGFAWTGVMTKDASNIARRYAQTLRDSSYSGSLPTSTKYAANFSRRYYEWPKGPSWYFRIFAYESSEGAIERCIDYRPASFHCLRSLIDSHQKWSEDPAATAEELLAAHADRYHGSPTLAQYKVEMARASSDEVGEIDLLRRQVEQGGATWTTYKDLGRRLVRIGEHAEAQEVWLSFPGFAPDGNLDAVWGSNYAEVAGSTLYWIGQHELAKPLLELAAGFGSGSGAHMSAGQRVALISGDLDTAMRWSAERVRRYESIYGLRDLMQLLHVTGESKLAWSIFDDFQAKEQNSQMWSGALVGHRVNSATLSDIAKWVLESEPRRTAIAGRGAASVDLAPRYLLMAGTMDRNADADLADIVDSAHSRSRPRYRQHRETVDANGVEVRPRTADLSSISGQIFHDALIPTPRDEQHVDVGTEVDHRYTMLARAMAAFAKDDHARAFELFNECAYFYYLDEYLPYYAFSASRIGRAGHIADALQGREDSLEKIRLSERSDQYIAGYRFDEDLTYAVLASFGGDHVAAIGRLNAALNNKPYINDRSIYPMYQLVDLAERLYSQTGQSAYRDFALELSRRHTVILPMYAWAYYVVARHSASEAEQIRNAATALHLDPLSARRALLSSEQISKALDMLDRHGPSLLNRSAAEIEEST